MRNVRAYFNLIDIFVLSSLQEGLPITILEAMAERVPIVSTAVGGIPEVLTHEDTAYLVEPANPEQLAAGIINLLENPDKTLCMAKKAEEIIRDDYSSEYMASQYEHVYLQILNN